MDEVQRIFTHKSVLELLDQATEDTIEDASKKRRDGHFCLQLPEYSSPLSKLANARSLLKNENLKLEDVDDRLLLKTMKTKTMGRKSLAYGRTYGLGYNLYYHRNPTRRGRSVREKNIPSRLVLELKQYLPKTEEEILRLISYPQFKGPSRDQDEAWQPEDLKRFEEHEARYDPSLDAYEKATTPIKTITIDIRRGEIPQRYRNGKGGVFWKWDVCFSIKRLWLAPSPGETPREDIRFLIALYLWQEGMIQLNDRGIYEIFSKYLKTFGITETLPAFLDYLQRHYTLAKGWQGLRAYISKAKRGFRQKNMQEYIVDDLEKAQEKGVREEKGSKRSRIPKEQSEEGLISVDAAVIQLRNERYEISRDTIYRWIKQGKVPVTQNRYGRIRLTQESIEQIRQILEQKKILKQRQEKRKNLMDYLMAPGRSYDTAKKRIQRQLKAGKTIEDIARAELAKHTNKEMENGDIGNNMDSLFA